MFLREEVDVEVDVTPEEAQQEITEACLGLSELANASMQAGYSIKVSLQEGMLSEAEAEKKEDGMVKRVAARVKAFLVKIKDYVVKFFKGLTERLKKIWQRVSERVRGTTVKMPKSAKKAIDDLTKIRNAVEARIVKGEKEAAIGSFDKVLADVEKLIRAEIEGDKFAEVKLSELAALQRESAAMAKKANAGQAELDRAVAEAESASRAPEVTPEIQAALTAARKKADAWRLLVSVNAKYVTAVSQVLMQSRAKNAK